MLSSLKWAASPLLLATLLSGCGSSTTEEKSKPETAEAKGDPKAITLTAQQITAAGISIVRPSIGGGAGAIELPATIEADPQGIQIVSAAIGGRVVTLNRNLGERVRRGDALAVIESREAAQLKGEVEATRARSALAQSQLRREQRLFAERISPEQDLIAARTVAAEARIAQRQAQQQLSAAGGGGGSLNRLALRSPISGQIIARSVMLGQTVAADAELYRVANLSKLSLSRLPVRSRCGPGTEGRDDRRIGARQAGDRACHLRLSRAGRPNPVSAGHRIDRQCRRSMAGRGEHPGLDTVARHPRPAGDRGTANRGPDDRWQDGRVRPIRNGLQGCTCDAWRKQRRSGRDPHRADRRRADRGDE